MTKILDEVLKDLREKKFSTHKIQEGYDLDEVDDFLDDVLAKLETFQKEGEANFSKRSAITNKDDLKTEISRLQNVNMILAEELENLNEQLIEFTSS
jgi:DivIVA domain-containing protein